MIIAGIRLALQHQGEEGTPSHRFVFEDSLVHITGVASPNQVICPVISISTLLFPADEPSSRCPEGVLHSKVTFRSRAGLRGTSLLPTGTFTFAWNQRASTITSKMNRTLLRLVEKRVGIVEKRVGT